MRVPRRTLQLSPPEMKAWRRPGPGPRHRCLQVLSPPLRVARNKCAPYVLKRWTRKGLERPPSSLRSCRRRLDPHSLSETAAQDRLLAYASRNRGNIPVVTPVECLADLGQGFHIPAAAQEALLVELLGLRGAGQIDRLADRFRAEPGQGPLGPPPVALPPDPLPAVPPHASQQ